MGRTEPTAGFDESRAPDGSARPGWEELTTAIAGFDQGRLDLATSEVDRLLADDGVTYTVKAPEARPRAWRPRQRHRDDDEPAETLPWQLDPLPLVVDGREWRALERGLVQRAELLDAVLADLHGEQTLLSRGLLPPEVVFGHPDYLRATVGTRAADRHRLFLSATDLGRDAEGEWRVLSDRAEAPAGAGFAMENRRVISRVLPDLYRSADLFRLTPFFNHLRTALLDSASSDVEDPRVVVLTPGAEDETAFDQAFLASLLGFPLVEGNDLTVRDGRVFMRALGKFEPVDVIFRWVESRWTDSLELLPRSSAGVAGLTEAVRQGTVTVINSLGSGVLENPGLLPFLPELCQELLAEPLRLPSVETWWCGDEESRNRVIDQLDSLVIRPISPRFGTGVRGGQLTTRQRKALVEQIRRHPHRYTGQEFLPLSTSPSVTADGVQPATVTVRAFAVQQGNSYAVMPGGLAQLATRSLTADAAVQGERSKDVWVLNPEDALAAPAGLPDEAAGRHALGLMGSAMVPRVLDDLFWFGRYAERAEARMRLVLAAHALLVEAGADRRDGQALERLVSALRSSPPADESPDSRAELRELVLGRGNRGSAVWCISRLTRAGQGVRDQLSNDVWMVIAGIERALTTLRVARFDSGAQLADSGEQVLSGLLALSGITSDNMVRDPGWHLLDSGRGLERAQQVTRLLVNTLVRAATPRTEQLIIESTLTAAESIVTFRRRDGGRFRVESVLDLMILDVHNPRSVAFQLRRVEQNLTAVPGSTATDRPLRILADLRDLLTDIDPHQLCAVDEGRRGGLEEFLDQLREQLNNLADAIGDQYLQQPPSPQPMWRVSTGGGA